MDRISANCIKVTIALVVMFIAFNPGISHARAGGGSSMGSRASRTFAAPAPTRTAPQVSPIARSVTPPSEVRPSTAPVYGQQSNGQQGIAQPGFAQRNPFVSGLMGGLIGAGIGGMLFGHGFSGMWGAGGMGFAGSLGLLLQVAMLGGVSWWVYSMVRGRINSRAMAGANTRDSYIPTAYSRGDQSGGARGAAPPLRELQGQSPDEIGLTQTDLNEFERLLGVVQQSWSKADIAALRRVASPEMLSYFSEQLAINTSAGVTDTITDVMLEQADLAEAWREAEVECATVSLRFSALDYTTAEDGTVIKGSMTTRSEATESWTFMRQSSGPNGTGRWLLSAIQQ